MDLMTYRRQGNSIALMLFGVSFVFLFLLRGDQFDAFFAMIAADLALLTLAFGNAVVANLVALFKGRQVGSSLLFLVLAGAAALVIGYLLLFLILSAGGAGVNPGF